MVLLTCHAVAREPWKQGTRAAFSRNRASCTRPLCDADQRDSLGRPSGYCAGCQPRRLLRRVPYESPASLLTSGMDRLARVEGQRQVMSRYFDPPLVSTMEHGSWRPRARRLASDTNGARNARIEARHLPSRFANRAGQDMWGSRWMSWRNDAWKWNAMPHGGQNWGKRAVWSLPRISFAGPRSVCGCSAAPHVLFSCARSTTDCLSWPSPRPANYSPPYSSGACWNPYPTGWLAI